MKEAPDKIYVKEFDEGISQMWSSIKATETTANVQHEYIRKDALLEWAKVMHGIYLKRYEGSTCTCGEHWGQMVAFQRMIDKLNSL